MDGELMFEMREAFGSADEAQLSNLEAVLGARLPADYRAFLKQHNGGKSMLADFEVPAWGDTFVSYFLGLHPTDPDIDIHKAINRLSDVLCNGQYLPFATDPAGNYVFLNLGNEGYGETLFWDHESDEEPIKLADSFKAFASMLTEER